MIHYVYNFTYTIKNSLFNVPSRKINSLNICNLSLISTLNLLHTKNISSYNYNRMIFLITLYAQISIHDSISPNSASPTYLANNTIIHILNFINRPLVIAHSPHEHLKMQILQYLSNLNIFVFKSASRLQ
jgi:hypothetical protein